MKEFREIHGWITQNNKFPEPFNVSSLAAPEFEYEGENFIAFSTNNYLGLSAHKRVVDKAKYGLDKYGVGNCESRLLGGDLDIYRELEAKLAEIKHKESSLIFATGYLTNLGVLSSLPKAAQICRMYGYRSQKNFKYLYLSDEYNHISIREGIRMSGVPKTTYKHLDLNHLELFLKKHSESAKIIVTDGVFSQDGDIAPLPELIYLAEKYEAILYVDDAHGTGILGKTGGGISEHFNCYSPVMISMGTMSKAYGALGGFIATETYISSILKYTCSGYGFTSTIPPDQAFAILESLQVIIDEPERREKLWSNQKYFVERMGKLGYKLICTETPIIPVLIGDEKLCDEFSKLLKKERIHVDAIKFPAVGINQSRLRVMMNAMHSQLQIDKLLSVFDSLKSKIADK